MIPSTLPPQSLTYDSAYQQVQRHTAVPIDERGRCFIANGVSTMVLVDKTASPTQPKTEQQFLRWKCCSECKLLTKAEVSATVELKDSFDKPMIELRQDLDMCDSGCPNKHYTRVDDVKRQGLPLICSNDSGCSSKLRILRAASAHFPVLRTLQNTVCLNTTTCCMRVRFGVEKWCKKNNSKSLLSYHWYG